MTPPVPMSEKREAGHGQCGSALTDPDPVNQKILRSIADMGNTVLSKRAASDLHRYAPYSRRQVYGLC